ncbi:hypothetical protein PMPD1_2455 [Paramixta manurensis]|uniref:Uncharacterized protein n=1 Tax=Paramixta manurensis TaxID=2740817 RepID=A0A6M8UG55_9GAMM|nr:hypothetical protein PMPD1_2455 [Erwiniaceae bacterium PD-1]
MASAYGMELRRDDGSWFASPDYTPLNLVQVIDQSFPRNNAVNINVQTNVPNAQQCLVFVRSVTQTGCCIYKVNNGANGFKVINLTSTYGSSQFSSISFRFYVFSDFVAFAPNYGIFFYRNGKMIYCGNCLPLQIKWYAANATNPGKSAAVMPGYATLNANAGPPGPGGGATLILLMGWVGQSNGISQSVYLEVNRNSNTPIITPPNAKGVLYIETALYDQYYRQSLGL